MNIKNENIPLASKEQTDYVENKLIKFCHIYMDQVESISEKRFGCLIQRAIWFDLERGKVPGYIPKRYYIHNEWFSEWENELWIRINSRLDHVSDDFIPSLNTKVST